MDGGKKYDQNKPRYDLIPPKTMHFLLTNKMKNVANGIAQVLEFGASKYGEWNWFKGIRFSRLYAAALRHMMEGDTIDPESGLEHWKHVASNIMFLLELPSEFDDLEYLEFSLGKYEHPILTYRAEKIPSLLQDALIELEKNQSGKEGREQVEEESPDNNHIGGSDPNLHYVQSTYTR